LLAILRGKEFEGEIRGSRWDEFAREFLYNLLLWKYNNFSALSRISSTPSTPLVVLGYRRVVEIRGSCLVYYPFFILSYSSKGRG
jgi:hypothetical protein